MSSSTTLPEAYESESWEPLPWLSVKGDFQDHLMEPWLKAQSEVPFHMSHRPSGKMTGQTQQKMKTVKLEAFFKSVQSLQKQRPKSKWKKVHPHLRHRWSLQKESNIDPKINNSVGKRRFLLCMQIVQVFNGPSSREEKDQHYEALLSEIFSKTGENYNTVILILSMRTAFQ